MNRKTSKTIRPCVRASLTLCLCLWSAGCAGLFKQQPVAKGYFAIEPGQPESSSADHPTTRSAAGVMRVRTLRVSPPYDGVAFVYRIGPSQFDTDYYNNFIAPPASLMTGALTQWLAREGRMTVCEASSDLRADLTLEGSVTRLYIDSATSPPKAVIAARFFLTRDRNGDAQLLFDKPYEASVPVPAHSPAGFASGWGQAYRQILLELTADLRNETEHRR
jgi:ABC-type uncharacterized transport system auxiliary subunit